MKFKITVMMCSMFVAGVANAECPASLQQQDMVKCQAIEKSGIDYQQWKQAQNSMSSDAAVSPITGEDVRGVTPAAGKANIKSKVAQ